MAFQFLCPQGHLLMGNESHMGMQTQCPQCGMMFIIPVVDVQAAQTMQAAPQEAYVSHDIYEPAVTHPGLHDYLQQPAPAEVAHEQAYGHASHADTGHLDFAGPSHQEVGDEPTPGIVHIPCPNGHELETPLDMLGQEVLCPHCGSQFRLKNEDSREFREQQEKLDRESARVWFNWAIAAAIVMGGGLLVLVGIALSK
jgi:hypothetical protein